MSGTRQTLLHRVRDPGDREAWEEFFELYAPLLEGYARAHGLARADAEEVRDQCLEVLARKLPSFEYQPMRGSFQAWLQALARGKVIDLVRAKRVRAHESVELSRLADAGSAPDLLWEREWRAEHLRHALERVRRAEDPERFHVFELLLVQELSVAEVSARTGLTAAQIYKIKAALLKRVREVLVRLGDGAEAGLDAQGET
ncbi:MAG: sigma-70 family RNA polymerase sigma factor [Planctomycetes bacterium]|nr:sigma-70 family RNA polymerase sigma factor [Planctomycetota bacterium]